MVTVTRDGGAGRVGVLCARAASNDDVDGVAATASPLTLALLLLVCVTELSTERSVLSEERRLFCCSSVRIISVPSCKGPSPSVAHDSFSDSPRLTLYSIKIKMKKNNKGQIEISPHRHARVLLSVLEEVGFGKEIFGEWFGIVRLGFERRVGSHSG